MKLTKEQDARLCAEYGVTPGEWVFVYAPVAGPAVAARDETGDDYIADCFASANARLMAASKEMVALLEIAEERLCYMSDTVSRDICLDISALLDGLKGGSNEED